MVSYHHDINILPSSKLRAAFKRIRTQLCVGHRAQEDTMQRNTNSQTLCHPRTPCFHFLLCLSQSFHLYFLASDSRFPVLPERAYLTPLPVPTMHPVSDTCQLSRPHQSAEHRSSFPSLILLTSLFPLQPSVKPTKVT